MIVTRSWLSEFIDLSDVSNDTLYRTFNAIGLEVDSIEEITIPEKVVIGRILSCEKHPDADKLNVCKIDVGSGTRQIVCGAANVVNAEYVAVATIGAVLPGDFVIKHAKLRGVESEGMVCSSTELGLPAMGEGIMILDESIGALEVGKELGEYPTVADTVIELELTANRGDCLSIYGVARDLSVALDRELKHFEYKQEEKMKLGIAREAEIHQEGEIDADLHFKLANLEQVHSSFLIDLRLAMIDQGTEEKVDAMLKYAMHTTGIALRAYKSSFFRNEDKITVLVRSPEKGIVEVVGNGKVLSTVGVNQEEEAKATDESEQILIEASYINPDLMVEAIWNADDTYATDDLYYRTSRGSNPDMVFGLSYLSMLLDTFFEFSCYEGALRVEINREKEAIAVDTKEISSIIGMKIEKSRIVSILQHLEFIINAVDETVISATIPLFRHDIKNVQDVAEEIVRIIGINNIEAKPLAFKEANRLNATSDRYKVKKTFKNRAVGCGFYENVSYVFTQRSVLEKYGFATVEEKLELSNPIAEELNTLRTTILTNLLQAVKRNVSYSKKSIPLFEIGTVFNPQRQEKEVLSFVFSGHSESESVQNAGKPKSIDFAAFVDKISAIIGTFELVPCSRSNGLIHPYQSADIVVDGRVCGYLSKLHPTVQESYDIPVTFVAEIDLDPLLPKHTNAEGVSRFQGVYKDLSVVIDKSILYYEVAKVIRGLDLPMLKDVYPVDIYEDEKLGEKKSLTIRFFIQSMEDTLKESDIEKVMDSIMNALAEAFDAQIR
jgi:phenylalanyl-tRNA synthetase beta chain